MRADATAARVNPKPLQPKADLVSRHLFALSVSARRGRLYGDARSVACGATEAKPAEIGAILAAHGVPAENPPVVGSAVSGTNG